MDLNECFGFKTLVFRIIEEPMKNYCLAIIGYIKAMNAQLPP